jgi:hypothetical protein
MKTELEEAAEKYVKDFDLIFYDTVEEIPIKEFGKKDFINGAIFYKENISNSIEKTINAICKDNTHLLDTPEIQEIIKYFKK